jgi:hypothetical protein
MQIFIRTSCNPAGITYNKKTDRVRTTLLNPTFCWIAQQQQEAGHEKKRHISNGLSYAALVEPNCSFNTRP